MKKFFGRALGTAFILGVLCPAAFGLSDAEYKQMMQNSGFAGADKALTQAWGEAKGLFPDTEEGRAAFERLRTDQREWVATGRDEDAGKIMTNTELRGRHPSRTMAYAVATLARSEALPALARQYLSAAPGGEGETAARGASETANFPATGVCLGDSVRLREDPGLEGTVVGRANKGDRLTLLDEAWVDGERWFMVEVPGTADDGTEVAFILGRYVDVGK